MRLRNAFRVCVYHLQINHDRGRREVYRSLTVEDRIPESTQKGTKTHTKHNAVQKELLIPSEPHII